MINEEELTAYIWHDSNWRDGLDKAKPKSHTEEDWTFSKMFGFSALQWLRMVKNLHGDGNDDVLNNQYTSLKGRLCQRCGMGYALHTRNYYQLAGSTPAGDVRCPDDNRYHVGPMKLNIRVEGHLNDPNPRVSEEMGFDITITHITSTKTSPVGYPYHLSIMKANGEEFQPVKHFITAADAKKELNAIRIRNKANKFRLVEEYITSFRFGFDGLTTIEIFKNPSASELPYHKNEEIKGVLTEDGDVYLASYHQDVEHNDIIPKIRAISAGSLYIPFYLFPKTNEIQINRWSLEASHSEWLHLYRSSPKAAMRDIVSLLETNKYLQRYLGGHKPMVDARSV